MAIGISNEIAAVDLSDSRITEQRYELTDAMLTRTGGSRPVNAEAYHELQRRYRGLVAEAGYTAMQGLLDELPPAGDRVDSLIARSLGLAVINETLDVETENRWEIINSRLVDEGAQPYRVRSMRGLGGIKTPGYDPERPARRWDQSPLMRECMIRPGQAAHTTYTHIQFGLQIQLSAEEQELRTRFS